MKRLLTTVLLLALIPTSAHACTIFSVHAGGVALVGNNEDWQYSYASTGWVEREEGSYGCVCFSNAGYVQGGMNEMGLFYDGATCPVTEVPSDPEKTTLGWDFGEQMLKCCRNIDEAVEFLMAHNIPFGFADHLLIADKNGAAIVEWVDGDMRIIYGGGTQLVATNFLLTATNLGGYPCERYEIADEMLATGAPSAELLTQILQKTAQSWDGGGTKYSNIYDLNALTVTSYARAKFDDPQTIDLIETLDTLGYGRYDFDLDALR